jgi:hypothetical protein
MYYLLPIGRELQLESYWPYCGKWRSRTMGPFLFIIWNTKQKIAGATAEIRKHSSRALERSQWGQNTICDSVCKRKVSFESERFVKRGQWWSWVYWEQDMLNPLSPNDLYRRRAVSPLKIKIPVKICVKSQQIHQLFIQLINYVWYLLHVSALNCHLQGAFLVPSERCSIEEQSIEYCGWACC